MAIHVGSCVESTSASKFNKSMVDELEFNLPSFKVLAHVACTVVAVLGGVSVLVFLELRMIDRAHLRNPEIVDYATGAASWGAVSTSSVLVGAGLSVRGCAGGPVVQAALLAFGGGALLEAASVEIFSHLLHEAADVSEYGIAGAFAGIILFTLLHALLRCNQRADSESARHLDRQSAGSPESPGHSGHGSADMPKRSTLSIIRTASTNSLAGLIGTRAPVAAPSSVALWCGSVLHAIPEALVLGIMYNDRARESDYTPESSLGTGSNRLVAFAAALLLSKLPEALVASEALQQRGHGGTRVIGMWSGLVAISAACSFFISLAFDPARAKPRAAHAAQAAVEGVCGGMLGALAACTPHPGLTLAPISHPCSHPCLSPRDVSPRQARGS